MTDALFHSPVQSQESDERWTPKWVFDGLGIEFSMDPASPDYGLGFVPAAMRYTADTDGLSQQWIGRVWLNPPFSNATPWARKFLAHGNGVFLGPVANSAWCVDMWQTVDLVWFVRDFAFIHPTHAGRRSSMPLFFASMGKDCTAALVRLASSGVHDGVLLERVPEWRLL